MSAKLATRYIALGIALLLVVVCVVFQRASVPRLRTLVILHTNDIHAHVVPFYDNGKECEADVADCLGGVARQKTVIDRIRKQAPDSLLLDAGDQFSGTAYYGYYKGNVSHRVMNLLGYDLMSLGNHEFDEGSDQLAEFLGNLRFPVVCANLEVGAESDLAKKVKPYHIFPQYSLGVIGIITNTTGFTSNPGPNVRFTNPIHAVRRYAQELKRIGVKTIVVLSHTGYQEDVDLAAQTTDIDLIIGGHSHTFLSSNPSDPHHWSAKGGYPTVVRNLDGLPTYITQVWSWGRYVGHLKLQLDDQGRIRSIEGAPILLDGGVPEDPVALQVIQGLRVPLREYMDRVIGRATRAFDPPKYWTIGESAIGNLVGDAMLHARSTSRAVIYNSGDVQGGLEEGEIRNQEIFRVIPFDSSVVDLLLTGQQIHDLIEGVLCRRNLLNHQRIPGRIQVAGIRFTYDPNGPEAARLRSLEILDVSRSTYEPVHPESLYPITTLDFVAKGGDNLISPPVASYLTHGNLRSTVIRYIEEMRHLHPKLDGRIAAVSTSA
ncbi:Metallo-dependent phosphatase [Basidiobolus meristosporus CBS 931.73]|uniref:Metallo-dependent phosphatase n=1 Tax=Basidiobolus meristosporus CBS 931.73 TaxID=1314790 RepID=A0A1Y1YL24_9FUNG|nr:Metallo-dependent phosphatase [Basidiobolus meristosporus CBS 931.73]|eukprot:ORX98709.1 Metallo-dependent phosphatase [Basidiobolus meristosporus CBS 931.73]